MELSTRYTPKELEAPIYQAWEDSGAFRPASDRGDSSGETFTVCMPPPNVTGRLHMGHALNGTIQDIVVRHRRKAGFDTLWI
ncbi:MAG: valyl-tRNA synthetase, partial [Planctomycetota bacterium]